MDRTANDCFPRPYIGTSSDRTRRSNVEFGLTTVVGSAVAKVSSVRILSVQLERSEGPVYNFPATPWL
jgi:hypothetical protein